MPTALDSKHMQRNLRLPSIYGFVSPIESGFLLGLASEPGLMRVRLLHVVRLGDFPHEVVVSHEIARRIDVAGENQNSEVFSLNFSFLNSNDEDHEPLYSEGHN